MPNRSDTIEALRRSMDAGRIRFPASLVMSGGLTRNDTRDAFDYALGRPRHVNCRCVLPGPEDGDAYRRAIADAFRTPARQAELERANRNDIAAGRRFASPEDASRVARRAGEALESRHFFGEARVLGRNPLEEQGRERRSGRFALEAATGIEEARRSGAITTAEALRLHRAADVLYRPRAVRLETSDPRRARIPGELDPVRRTVRVAVHLGCPETTNPERPSLVIRCDQDRTRRCSGCSYVWAQAELMISPELAAIGIGVADVPEIEYVAAVGELDRRLSSSGFYGEEPEIPKEAEALESPSSRLPMYRPR